MKMVFRNIFIGAVVLFMVMFIVFTAELSLLRWTITSGPEPTCVKPSPQADSWVSCDEDAREVARSARQCLGDVLDWQRPTRIG